MLVRPPKRRRAEAGLPAAGPTSFDRDLFESPVVDSLVCCICQNVPRKPVEMSCGHICCPECLNEWLPVNPSCPLDRSPVDAKDVRVSAFASLQIAALRMRCPHTEFGCKAAFEVGKDGARYNEHVTKCGFAPTPCERCGDKSVVIQDKKEHDETKCMQREISCEFCSAKIKAADLTLHIETKDTGVPCSGLVPCPNKCSAPALPGSLVPLVVQRAKLPDHLKVCPLQVAPCDLCGERMQRRAFDAHMGERAGLHLARVTAAVALLRDENQALKEKVDTLTTELTKLTDEKKAPGAGVAPGADEKLVWQHWHRLGWVSSSGATVTTFAPGDPDMPTFIANRKLVKGVHRWLVQVEFSRSTFACIGVIRDNRTNSGLGWRGRGAGGPDGQGWALDVGDGQKVSHTLPGQGASPFCPPLTLGADGSLTLEVKLDLDRGTIEFGHGVRSLGTAFADVRGPVYPAVCFDGSTQGAVTLLSYQCIKP